MNAVFNYLELFSDEGVNINSFTPNDESDIDVRIFDAVLIQQMNKQQYKDFSHKLRVNDKSYHCGHEHDCCGCISSERIDLEYVSQSIFKLQYRVNLNY